MGKKIPELVRAMLTAREARLVMQKDVAKLEEREKALKAEIIAIIKADGASIFHNNLLWVEVKPKIKPVAENWAMIYGYIKSHDAFDLLQRRLTETAVKARWEDNEVIPGINQFPVDDLSVKLL